MKTQQLTTNVTTFREFAQGFSDPRHEQIDFVDVGEGKEMADWKLKSIYTPLHPRITVRRERERETKNAGEKKKYT